jgi:hypothetical protein
VDYLGCLTAQMGLKPRNELDMEAVFMSTACTAKLNNFNFITGVSHLLHWLQVRPFFLICSL